MGDRRIVHCPHCGADFLPARRKMGRKPTPIKERFFSHVKVTPSCWYWLGARRSDGYGAFAWGSAHRRAWEIFKGPIPARMLVLHRCDTPLCVNPDHLFLGTQVENVHDCARKGRRASKQGQRHHMAKLNDDQVREIRRACENGETQKAVAARFGIKRQTVGNIVRGERWPHLH